MLNRKLPILFGILALLISFSIEATQAQNRDTFSIATTTKRGYTLIRTYYSDGSLKGDVPINYNLQYSEFIAGNWLGDQEVSVLAMQWDDKQRYTAYIVSHTGEIVKELSLGKNVISIHSLEYNGLGASDLLVQYEQNDNLNLFLDPGITTRTQIIKVTSPNRTDPIVQAGTFKDRIAYLKIPDPNKVKVKKSGKKKKRQKNKRRTRRKKTKKNKKKNKKSSNKAYVQTVLSSGRTQNITVPEDATDFEVIRLAGDTPAVVYLHKKRIQVMSVDANGKTTEMMRKEKPLKATLLSGVYQNRDGDTLAFGTQNENIRLYNPISGSESHIKIDLNADATQIPDQQAPNANDNNNNNSKKTACETYFALQAELIKAYTEQNIKKVFEISEKLNNLEIPDNCYEEIPGGANIPEQPDPFDNNGVTHIKTYYRSGSNTGEFMGPCDKIYQAPDGTGKFLAKNSGYSNGQGSFRSVYLFPTGVRVQSAKILDSSFNKTLENLVHSGIANGARDHLRSRVALNERPDHVIAAWTYYDGVVCYKVPGGQSRVD